MFAADVLEGLLELFRRVQHMNENPQYMVVCTSALNAGMRPLCPNARPLTFLYWHPRNHHE